MNKQTNKWTNKQINEQAETRKTNGAIADILQDKKLKEKLHAHYLSE